MRPFPQTHPVFFFVPMLSNMFDKPASTALAQPPDVDWYGRLCYNYEEKGGMFAFTRARPAAFVSVLLARFLRSPPHCSPPLASRKAAYRSKTDVRSCSGSVSPFHMRTAERVIYEFQSKIMQTVLSLCGARPLSGRAGAAVADRSVVFRAAAVKPYQRILLPRAHQ